MIECLSDKTQATDLCETETKIRDGATESAICFGRHRHLMGVWNPGEASTAVVFVTAGMLHHVGPFRLHVELARTLQADGIGSLRFDLSGIGESLAIGSETCSIDRAASEIRQAIDWIQSEHQISRVILFGLCSGADDALHAALSDHRIVGVVAMDGCGYRTPMFYVHRVLREYALKLFQRSRWAKFIRRWCGGHDEYSPRSMPLGGDIREFPSHSEACARLSDLADRGVRLHFVYTGGVSEYFNHDGQFRSMFPELRGKPNVSHRLFRDLDHVAFLVEDRRELLRHVCKQIKAMAGTDVDRHAN